MSARASTSLALATCSGDMNCGRELWPTAQRQLEIVGACVDSSGLFVDPRNIWIFIDWEQKLERAAAMHGVLLYCYRQAAQLAELLGYAADSVRYRQAAERMAAAAQEHFYDEEKQLYVSGPNRQISLATQAWLILAGVPSKTAGATAMRKAWLKGRPSRAA